MRDRIKMRVGAGEETLAPTFGALDEIETALDMNIGSLYRMHLRRTLKLGELATIVSTGINAGLGDADIPSVAKHLYEQGVESDPVRRGVARYLLALGWAPEDAAGKFDAEWPSDTAPTDATLGDLAETLGGVT